MQAEHYTNSGWPPNQAGEYHGVELESITVEVIAWCRRTYGIAGERWFFRNKTIYFGDQADHTMFLLRWQ